MKYISFAIPCYNSEAYMEKRSTQSLSEEKMSKFLSSTMVQKTERRKSPNGTKLNIRRSSRRSKKKTEDTAMQSTADFLMPQENILK